MNTADAQQALDDLETQFSQWRKGKKHNREKIPEQLLRAASKLSEFIDEKQVRARLGISSKSFDRVKPTSPDSPIDLQAQPVFAEVAPPSALQIEVHMPSGVVISVSNLNESPLPVLHRLLGESL